MKTKILKSDHVFFEVDASSKKRVFERIGLLVEDTLKLPRAQIFDALLLRERLGSTGLGNGFALPHGKISGISNTEGFYLRLKTAVAFEAYDKQPVHSIFCLLVPETINQQEHLDNLKWITTVLSSRQKRTAIESSTSPEKIVEIFSSDQNYV